MAVGALLLQRCSPAAGNGNRPFSPSSIEASLGAPCWRTAWWASRPGWGAGAVFAKSSTQYPQNRGKLCDCTVLPFCHSASRHTLPHIPDLEQDPKSIPVSSRDRINCRTFLPSPQTGQAKPSLTWIPLIPSRPHPARRENNGMVPKDEGVELTSHKTCIK